MSRYEDVKDPNGRKLASITHHDNGNNSVYDSNHKFLGSTDKSGTRDSSSRIVADKPFPGLLINKKK